MAKKKANRDPEERLEELETRVDGLVDGVAALRREFAAAGVGRAPNPERAAPLDPEARRARRAIVAARARAAKEVGKAAGREGMGKVRSAETKAKLERAAADVLDAVPSAPSSTQPKRRRASR
jgi:hypothetical protein